MISRLQQLRLLCVVVALLARFSRSRCAFELFYAVQSDEPLQLDVAAIHRGEQQRKSKALLEAKHSSSDYFLEANLPIRWI